MPIESEAHPDAPRTNPKYDPDEDGDVENVDLSNYSGPATWETGRTLADADVVIDVPTDASTFDEAVTLATEYAQPRGDVDVVVNIESGHTLTTGVQLENGDYGYIALTSDDATVPADAGFTGNLFTGFNVRAPYWDILVDMGGAGSRGIELQNSQMEVNAGRGVINSGEKGVRVSSGTLRANSSNFSGADDEGIRVTGASKAMIQQADVSGCSVNGANGEAALYVSRASTVAAEGIDASNSGLRGIMARRSLVHASGADCSNASGTGLVAFSSSIIQAGGATLTGCSGQAVRSRYSSRVDVNGADCSDAGDHGVRADNGGWIRAENATINNAARRAINASDATIRARDAAIDNPTDDAVGCFSGGEVNVEDADITNLTDDAVFILRGAKVVANNATVDGSALTTGDVTVSAFNSLTSEGLIHY